VPARGAPTLQYAGSCPSGRFFNVGADALTDDTDQNRSDTQRHDTNQHPERRERQRKEYAIRYTLHQSIIKRSIPVAILSHPFLLRFMSAQSVLDACKRYPNPCPSDSLSVDGQSARCVIRHVSVSEF